jgi:hypothetical protein
VPLKQAAATTAQPSPAEGFVTSRKAGYAPAPAPVHVHVPVHVPAPIPVPCLKAKKTAKQTGTANLFKSAMTRINK